MTDKPPPSKIQQILDENGPGDLTPANRERLRQASLEAGREAPVGDFLRHMAETLKPPRPS